MAPRKKINVAIVGLGVGARFIPIYQRHPQARIYAICQRSTDTLDAIGDAFGVAARYHDYRALLKDPLVDAVQINTGIPDHARMTLEALKAGKHVACAAPMATRLADCRKIVDLCRRTRLKYMMMETAVYTREYLFIKDMHESGRLGKLQFLQASHQQDMDGAPPDWSGLPPMWYATQCVGPVLGLAGQPAEYVSCFGSGTIRSGRIKHYQSPFAVETAHLKIAHSDLTARITRSLFDVARQHRESIDVYGSKRSFEWRRLNHQPHVLHTAKRAESEIPELIDVPDYATRLPKAIRSFTTTDRHDPGRNLHPHFTQGTGPGGSLPHLVHEFVTALVGDRDPFPNAVQSANWTSAGLCAHGSALKGGTLVKLPAWSLG